ncbi:FAD/NAD(P)-binding domain-containing protein [Apiospora arundinis]
MGIRPLTTVSGVSAMGLGSRSHKVAIVGAGSAGMTIGHQLLRSGKFKPNEIALIDPSEWHHYQPGWTLNFTPDQNTLTFQDGTRIEYEQLVICPGIKVDFKSIEGLDEAVGDPHSPVSSIYSYETCDKVARDIAKFKKGKALFTHPVGVFKCAGAPQKIMWLALDGWRRAGLYHPDPAKSYIQISFATGMSVMFGVPKYSERLNALREQRGVEALFQHDLVAVHGDKATLTQADGTLVEQKFDFLNAVPKMRPHDFVKHSSLANEAGFVDVDQMTLRHTKYDNVWSAGDASCLQTSKTAAAITAQAPVLVANLVSSLEKAPLPATYNGYTSCPLLTEYGKVMLAEFTYGGEPHETFAPLSTRARRGGLSIT